MGEAGSVSAWAEEAAAITEEGEEQVAWTASDARLARALRTPACFPRSETRTSVPSRSESISAQRASKRSSHITSVINTEKGVVGAADKFAVEMSQAATKLPVYGEQEGPDLHDVLGHSATLLSQLSNALKVFGGHEASMRQCFKRIREREEQLDELRRRRRTTGQKADTAERKLSKMGPENKQLFTQTELLESLRGQMRQLDSDIVNEESKLGDFKRQ